ncbi:MAG: hypothetical protein KDK99_06665 [Verrucomicrobiales bacterium]|nr:hypothetical protein [Verrucomicrobiales bacterium]
MPTQNLIHPSRRLRRFVAAGFVVGFSLHGATVLAEASEVAKPAATFNAGVGVIDITPSEPIELKGMPASPRTAEVKTRLCVRALVLASGETRAAIVTLDTLKYPEEDARKARQQIERVTGIPAANIILCASHTHYGPLWAWYPDRLVTRITEAVTLAAKDLSPCTIGAATGTAEGLSECRRVIKDGNAWNRWQLKPEEAGKYPAEGPSDPSFDLLAITAADGRRKAIVYNFACHATSTRAPLISADFPGEVEEHVQQQLGAKVPLLFLTGACGDVNPVVSLRRNLFAEGLGGEILRCLDRLEPIANPTLGVVSREFAMPTRENPVFKEAEIARNWPAQLEHYRKSFDLMLRRQKPTYPYMMTALRIGNDFAIVTNANELFCGIGLSIKKQSPFTRTMVAEQTNGAHGYVPTAEAFKNGSYETWFGEHSHLSTKAGEKIETTSLELLNQVKLSQ